MVQQHQHNTVKFAKAFDKACIRDAYHAVHAVVVMRIAEFQQTAKEDQNIWGFGDFLAEYGNEYDLLNGYAAKDANGNHLPGGVSKAQQLAIKALYGKAHWGALSTAQQKEYHKELANYLGKEGALSLTIVDRIKEEMDSDYAFSPKKTDEEIITECCEHVPEPVKKHMERLLQPGKGHITQDPAEWGTRLGYTAAAVGLWALPTLIDKVIDGKQADKKPTASKNNITFRSVAMTTLGIGCALVGGYLFMHAMNGSKLTFHGKKNTIMNPQAKEQTVNWQL